MIIEFFGWAADRETFIEAITTTMLPDGVTPLATLAKDMNGEVLIPHRLIPCKGLQIDEIGPIMKVPPVINPETFEVITPAVMIEGWHVNFRTYEDLSVLLIQGKENEQTEVVQIESESPLEVSEGDVILEATAFTEKTVLKPVFDRTNLTAMIPNLEWDTTTGAGVPDGFIGPKGMKIFDKAAVNNPHRIWC